MIIMALKWVSENGIFPPKPFLCHFYTIVSICLYPNSHVFKNIERSTHGFGAPLFSDKPQISPVRCWSKTPTGGPISACRDDRVLRLGLRWLSLRRDCGPWFGAPKIDISKTHPGFSAGWKQDIFMIFCMILNDFETFQTFRFDFFGVNNTLYLGHQAKKWWLKHQPARVARSCANWGRPQSHQARRSLAVLPAPSCRCGSVGICQRL